MYITVDAIIKMASLLTAVTALIGFVFFCHKQIMLNRQQVEINERQNKELTVICYGLKGALEGLIEHGCDGPCKDALDKLNRHLNVGAHMPDNIKGM